MASWDKLDRPTEDGSIVPMQAPLIISASRSTDIPAFYADWFFHRLVVGYSAWTNPFNGVKSYVSYEKTRFIVFWSKNPRPLLDHLHILKERNINCYIQYTLNDYEQEGLEKVPSLANRIDTFKQLVQKLGSGSVVWRFDPLILTDRISVDDLLRKVQNIGNQLKDYTKKLVFSYADIDAYRKVKSNLRSNGINSHEWTTSEMEEFASRLSEMNQKEGWNYQLATCGEQIDISKYGIQHNRCVDADLITRIAWKDKILMDFMKVKIEEIPQATLFGQPELPAEAIILPDSHYFISKHRKDPGQRKFCECMVSKDIGEYNTCPHLCEYCYANASKQLALQNWRNHQKNKNAETITGK
ncbi:MAG: DUF1848 domain-containing protein [Bacteroidaceae bacterium]|nr:DUF1848 domain-containing protein [Bacteroidaceae bacterium]